jgi:DNA-binding CsgD family transcriptional regulator
MTRPDITDRNAEIVSRWMAGENRADICRVMDLHRHIVNRALVGLERTGITERDAKIVAMYKAGKTRAEIIAELPTTRGVVQRALYGMERHPNEKTLERRATSIRMYRDGMKIIDIARKLKVKHDVIRHDLKDEPRRRQTTVKHCRKSGGYHLGQWSHMTDAAMAIVAAKIKGNETVIACMARLIVQNGKEG